jgi:hypothetical protein
MKKTLLLVSSSILGLTNLFAQTPSTTIATWKNDAKGAYNIIHDDFGDNGVIGIQNYADTMHFNRGLKFTFGAITSACEADPNIYNRAKTMINSHGHEIINHSHTHSCAVGNESCGGTGENYQWAVPGTTDELDIEVDYSTSSIKTGTGYTPRFFIYPYDQFNDNANNYLKSKGYLGSRTGTYNAASDMDFEPDAQGFFRTALVVDVQTVNGVTNAVNLNYWVDQAIANKQWVNRELHNIGSTGWGSVSVSNYRTHLNYVKSKVTSGDLWVGTISEILTYQVQKLNYANPITTYSSQNKEINISWSAPSFNVASYLAPLQVKSPVTLKVNLAGLSAMDYVITQAGKTITTKKVKNGILYFDAYPHEGSIKISLADCPSLCITSNPSNQSVTEGATSVTFSVNATGTTEQIAYQWMKNGNNIQNATGATLTLTNVQLADSGLYSVKVIAGLSTETSTSAKLTVLKKVTPLHTPFKGTALQIPGKIEAEDFDNGGQGIAFNDLSNSNEGDATSYRSGTIVDIENCTDGGSGYNLGYTVAGEWLKYTVDIAKSQDYNLEIRYATLNANPSIKLYVNDTAITGAISLTNSGGWTKFKSFTLNNIPITAGTNKVLKVEILANDGNFNYFTFTPSVVTSLDSDHHDQIGLIVYPNPSKGGFTVKGLHEGQLQVININGEVIKEFNIKADQDILKVDEILSNGIYIIKYIGTETSQSVRFVKF